MAVSHRKSRAPARGVNRRPDLCRLSRPPLIQSSTPATMNQPAAARAASDASVAAAINRNYLGDEEQIVRELADAARLPAAVREKIAARAAQLVEGVRTTRVKRTGLDAFMRQYDLSSRGRRAADVRGRSAAAHSRRADRRQADPRQARRGRLEEAPRRSRFAVRQRVDLGPDADRPLVDLDRRHRRDFARRVRAPRRPRSASR